MESRIAADLKKALTEAGQWPKFIKLPPSHRRRYAEWIEEAKQPETRARRIAKACQMVADYRR